MHTVLGKVILLICYILYSKNVLGESEKRCIVIDKISK